MRHSTLAAALWLAAALGLAATCTTPASAAIRRDPNGVNVASQGATTVFITFGGLVDQVPVEAFWCGELVPAAPDLGSRCRPGTIFGQLPLRFDQSRLAASGSVFTDIMSIPPSVARRAYQAARRGEHSAFFYVRRFRSTVGGPDEYVFVTCRLAGGGARSPLALLDVQLSFASEEPLQSVERDGRLPPLMAHIAYNGTGRLQGRWEVVLPGDEPPASRDLLTEATLPPEERPLQRRFAQLERFNVFLPPTGAVTVPGPDPARLPTAVEGLYQVLLRVEASDDKEGDSSLELAGAGVGVVHTGAVAGFPLPVLRYFVGSLASGVAAEGFAPLLPAAGAVVPGAPAPVLSWTLSPAANLYRVELAGTSGGALFAAVVQQGIGSYQLPPFVRQRSEGGAFRWRVVALGPQSEERGATGWRQLTWGPP